MLIATQTANGLIALTLGLLVVTHIVELWMVFVVAAALGLVLSVDNPTRQSFVREMVSTDNVSNAVVLNSILVNASRVIGPALAGGLIATVGIGTCFLVNAASFIAVIFALVIMNPKKLRSNSLVERAPGQLREGLRYVRARPELLIPLVMMALVCTFAYEFPVVLRRIADYTLHGQADVFGFLTAAMGAGAVLGGLALASLGMSGLKRLTLSSFAFGVAMVLTAVAPTFGVMLLTLFLTGAASVAFMSTGNSTLQLFSEQHFRGRVMALWAVAFAGSTAIGGPIIGAASEVLGPRYGLAIGALACLSAAAIGAIALHRGLTLPEQQA